jgi:copper homeostasis protein CutC
MRNILIVALAAAGLCACASGSQREAAILQCQAVGISQSDPQFDLCTRAYTLQANQDNLEVTYHRALNPTYDKRGLAHQWYGY